MTEKSLAIWRDENSGGQNNQDEGEEKQLLNILESQPSDQSNRIEQIQDSCCADSRPEKQWRFTKLHFIDISVNVQKLIPTVRVPHVQHKDKSPMRTVQKAEEKSHIRSLTQILEILMQVPTTRMARKTVEAHCKNS